MPRKLFVDNKCGGIIFRAAILFKQKRYNIRIEQEGRLSPLYHFPNVKKMAE